MPTYSYQPLSANGSSTSGLMIDAPDRAAAVRILRQQGVTPSRVEEVVGKRARLGSEASGSNTARTVGQASRGRRMSRAEMASFIRELATAIQAGLPLVQALKTIARQSRGHSAVASGGRVGHAMLEHLIHGVEHGKPLSEAAASWGKPFNELSIGLIRAGEVSGKMGDVLEQAANLLDRDLKLRRSLIAGLMYPAILAVLILIAIVVIVVVIVPRILEPLQGRITRADLPLPTRMVTGTADFVGAYWWLIAGVIGGGLLLFSNMYREPAGRLAIDGWLLRLPLLGKLLRDVAVARFTRTLGTLVTAGLPALPALRITRATLGNKAMEAVIEEVCEQVAAGKTISEPMERSGYFPPLLTQIVGVGERSGRLPQMLGQAAGVFEDRTETSIKIFTTAFPPILVVIAAVVVGFVIAAILLPLLQMQEMIG